MCRQNVQQKLIRFYSIKPINKKCFFERLNSKTQTNKIYILPITYLFPITKTTIMNTSFTSLYTNNVEHQLQLSHSIINKPKQNSPFDINDSYVLFDKTEIGKEKYHSPWDFVSHPPFTLSPAPFTKIWGDASQSQNIAPNQNDSNTKIMDQPKQSESIQNDKQIVNCESKSNKLKDEWKGYYDGVLYYCDPCKPYCCVICNLDCTTLVNLNQHVVGNRHMKKLRDCKTKGLLDPFIHLTTPKHGKKIPNAKNIMYDQQGNALTMINRYKCYNALQTFYMKIYNQPNVQLPTFTAILDSGEVQITGVLDLKQLPAWMSLSKHYNRFLPQTFQCTRKKKNHVKLELYYQAVKYLMDIGMMDDVMDTSFLYLP